MNKKHVLVFDLYNTLVYIHKPKHSFVKIYKASTNGFNRSLSGYLKLIMTHDLDEVFTILPREFQELYRLYEEDLNTELESVKPFSDVEKVLKELGETYTLCLLSNLASPYKSPVYTLGLDVYFNHLVFSCDCGFIKPDINLFNTLEKQLEVDKNQILMIGDSYQSDILGAQQAGWSSVQLSRGKEMVSKDSIQSLDRLIPYLEEREGLN